LSRRFTARAIKLDRKRKIRRTGCKWEDNIKIDLREIGRLVWTEFMWLRIGTGGGLL
jgi:hypothetical protein